MNIDKQFLRNKAKTNSSPKTMIKHCFNKPNKSKKIQLTNFRILKFHEFYMLDIYNYKVSQLKEICSFYKIKKSGNKDELTYNLYNHLRCSFYALKMQKLARGFLQRLYNNLHGPAYLNRSKCINDSDFCTLDSLKTIPYYQFFTIESQNQIYGFDIKSLFNLILSVKDKEVSNPYTREKIPHQVFIDIKRLIKLSKIIKPEIDIKIEKDQDIDKSKLEQMHIISLFQEINGLGNYADSEWFECLDTRKYIMFIRELYDIWSYRAQLSNQVQYNIFPHGRPFYHIDLHRIQNFNHERIRYAAIKLIENMIKHGVNRDSKCLGAYYVLAALTLVNEDAREALPWLYQSVAHF